MKGTWSVWKLPYGKRYYLTHPWKWFHDVWQNITDAYRRARYGWTYCDAWNWNTWFLEVTPAMLRHIAKYGNAYPGFPPFDGERGYEKWHDWLNEVADLLESGQEDWQDEHNEYYEDFIKEISEERNNTFTDENGWVHHKARERTELDDKYYARSKELAEQGNKNIHTALSMISEHFWEIWD